MSWGVDYGSVDGNKPPDWKALQGAGGSFVWVRASFAYFVKSHQAYYLAPDPAFARDWGNIPGNFVRGAYMFPVPEATQSPEEQVAAFAASVKAAGGLRPSIDFPPCLDVEFPHGIAGTGKTRDELVKWITSAVLALRTTFGVWPIIYTSGRVWNDTDADCLGNPATPGLTACPLWLARYPYRTRAKAVLPPPDGLAPPGIPTPWGDEWHAHQYQGDALDVPGFTATVDLDRFREAKLGDRGGHVLWAKRRLLTVPAPFAGPLDTGSDLFDEDLDRAVKALQSHLGLAQDGVIGPKTFAAIAWL